MGITVLESACVMQALFFSLIFKSLLKCMTITFTKGYKTATAINATVVLLYNYLTSDYFDIIMMLGQFSFIQLTGTAYYLIGWRR